MNTQLLERALGTLESGSYRGTGEELFRLLCRSRTFYESAECPSNSAILMAELARLKDSVAGWHLSVDLASHFVTIKPSDLAREEQALEETCRIEWRMKSDLHSEFGSFERFFAFRRAVAKGVCDDLPARPQFQPESEPVSHVKVDPSLPLEQRCRLRWDGEPQTRREYRDNFEAFVAGERAFEKGWARVLRR